MTVPLPSSSSPVDLADWAEAVMLAEGVDSLSKAEVRRRLSSTGAPDDTELGLLWGELRRRAGLGVDVYPFQVGAGVLDRLATVDPTRYAALLLLSLEYAAFRRRKRWGAANLILDRLARDALVAYLGSGGEGLRFAWPQSDGRPIQFTAAIRWLADLLNLEVGSGTKNPSRKDGGVDVVAWRPFRDGRSKFSIVLAQCTIELDFKNKATDVHVNHWCSWIQFGTEPSVALVVPFVIAETDQVWEDIHHTCTIALDRTRLTELLGNVPPKQSDTALLEEWVKQEIQALVA